MSSVGERLRAKLLGVLVVGAALSASAQTPPAADAISGFERDRDRLEAPTPLEAEAAPAPALEVPAFETPASPVGLIVSEPFLLRGVRIVGSTVFSDRRLAEAVAPFLDRRVEAETLPTLTDAITRLYVDAGYVGSGAVVPEQNVEGGLLRVEVVEGRLVSLDIETSGRLAESWVETRMRAARGVPFSLATLDETLRVLQLDPRVARVDAVVVPGARLGDSRVRLRVEEGEHRTMEARAANDLAPALGGRRITGTIAHRSLLGRADTLRASVSGARGLIDVDLGYRHPIGPWQTELELTGSYAEGRVVEGAFRNARFRNEIIGYGVGLVQTVHRGLEDEVRARATLERRTSRLLFGDDADFPVEVVGTNTVRLSTLRLETEWIHREQDQVLAARIRGTFGLDLFNASTPNGAPGLPDGVFQALLLQLQYARRVETPLGPGELVARSDLQWASGTLFSLESFAMGGASTVRGYAENAIVTDNGWLASLEFRAPLLTEALRPHDLRIAPFVDFGQAWNDGDRRGRRFRRTYTSVGAGLVYRYGERFSLRLDYGIPLVSPSDGLERDRIRLQGHGLHLEATLAVF